MLIPERTVFIEVHIAKKEADFGNGLESLNFRKIKRKLRDGQCQLIVQIIKSKYSHLFNTYSSYIVYVVLYCLMLFAPLIMGSYE